MLMQVIASLRGLSSPAKLTHQSGMSCMHTCARFVHSLPSGMLSYFYTVPELYCVACRSWRPSMGGWLRQMADLGSFIKRAEPNSENHSSGQQQQLGQQPGGASMEPYLELSGTQEAAYAAMLSDLSDMAYSVDPQLLEGVAKDGGSRADVGGSGLMLKDRLATHRLAFVSCSETRAYGPLMNDPDGHIASHGKRSAATSGSAALGPGRRPLLSGAGSSSMFKSRRRSALYSGTLPSMATHDQLGDQPDGRSGWAMRPLRGLLPNRFMSRNLRDRVRAAALPSETVPAPPPPAAPAADWPSLGGVLPALLRGLRLLPRDEERDPGGEEYTLPPAESAAEWFAADDPDSEIRYITIQVGKHQLMRWALW